MITEIGAGALYNYRSPANVKWSEERQREIIGAQLEAALGHPGTSGLFIWQFCDVRVTEDWFAEPSANNEQQGRDGRVQAS